MNKDTIKIKNTEKIKSKKLIKLVEVLNYLFFFMGIYVKVVVEYFD